VLARNRNQLFEKAVIMRASTNLIKLMLLVCTLLLSHTHILCAQEVEPSITVSGMAEVLVVPDQVVLTAGVESRAKSVADACSDNDSKIREIIEFLKKSGIEEQYIHTEYVSIEPIMRSSERFREKGSYQTNANQSAPDVDPFDNTREQQIEQPVGYMASRQFAITLVDLTKFETIYKGLIERGINRVRGIEFRTSELRHHRDRVRLQAVRAAKEKAEAMSKELGARLASIRTISESPNVGHASYGMQNSISDPFGGAAPAAEQFAVGQITVRAVVDIVFNLGDAEMEN
jgi:uncharacterized protein